MAVTFSSTNSTQLQIIDFTVIGRYQPVPSYTVTFSAAGLSGPHTVPWNTPVVINLYGVPDAVAEGVQTYGIHFALTSGDSAFNNLSVPDEPVKVYDAGVTDSPTSISNLSEGGSTSYTVVLNGPPGFMALPTALGGNQSEQVTVSLVPDTNPSTYLTVDSSTTLTFNRSNWNVPQTVTITAIDDGVCTATNYSTSVIETVSSNITFNKYMDSPYGGPTSPAPNVTAPDMPVTVVDNDCPGPSPQTGGSAPALNGAAPQGQAPQGNGSSDMPPAVNALGSP